MVAPRQFCFDTLDACKTGRSMLTNIRKTRMQFRLVADPDERFERAERIALSCKERGSALFRTKWPR